jgi:hypothetical protein
LREIVDELYLFSLAPESLGKIIAQRTRTSESAEGENIFVRLGIDKDELAFLNQDDFYGRKIPRTVVCQRGGESHLVLIDMLSSREIPVGLAMEIPRPCHSLGATYSGREQMISPSAQKLIDKYGSTGYDPETEISVARSISAFFDLAQAADSDGTVSDKLSNMLRAVAELVCLPIECSVMREDFCFDSGSVLLHSNACLFTAVAMAMAARRYSNERKLYALISQREDFVSISLAYEGGEDEWRGEKLLRDILGDADMICEIGTRETRKVCSMAPCYADEGLAGVKEKMNERQMLEFWK